MKNSTRVHLVDQAVEIGEHRGGYAIPSFDVRSAIGEFNAPMETFFLSGMVSIGDAAVFWLRHALTNQKASVLVRSLAVANAQCDEKIWIPSTNQDLIVKDFKGLMLVSQEAIREATNDETTPIDSLCGTETMFLHEAIDWLVQVSPENSRAFCIMQAAVLSRLAKLYWQSI